MLSYGDTAIVGSIPIRFILTYTTSDFTVDDVVAIGGEVSDFQQEESLMYTATFNSVVAASDMRSIHIPTHVFTDAHGESNHESNRFQWNYDNSRPTITITAQEGVSGFASNDAALNLIFTLSEPVVIFTTDDITISGGSISLTSISDTEYTGYFTPSGQGLKTIVINANTLQDKVGHGNLASNTFEWTYDSIAPTIMITADEGVSGFTSKDATLSLTFTLSEPIEEGTFTTGVITISGGSISLTSISDTEYTGYFTPSGQGLKTIVINANTLQDKVGHGNLASNTFEWTYDSIAPTIMITADEGVSGFTSKDATLSLTFTLSEPIEEGTFTTGVITISGGSISLTRISDTEYTGNFSPSGTGLKTIVINANMLQDKAGNGNLASNTFEWTYDSIGPTITITADEVESGFASGDDSLSLTFEFNEPVLNFTVDDVTFVGGDLSEFSGSGKTYKAKFIPTGEGEKAIRVRTGTFTDMTGNPMEAGHSNMTDSCEHESFSYDGTFGNCQSTGGLPTYNTFEAAASYVTHDT